MNKKWCILLVHVIRIYHGAGSTER